MRRIVVADDHAVVRKGLRLIVSEAPDLTIVGEASSADELLSILRSREADAVILDLSLGTRSGIDILKHIKSEFPRMPVLILSMHREDLFAERVLSAGASGYVQKDGPPEELLIAIRRVSAGGRYVSPEMAERLAAGLTRGGAPLTPHERLSDREFEILRLLGSGMSVSEIARSLNLSVKTVSTHRVRILEKMALHTNADIVEYVVGHDLR